MTVAEPDWLTVFASVTVNDSVFEPLVVSVRLNVPVPVYGVVPPVALTVQLNGLPIVTPEVGQETVTTSAAPPTGTGLVAVFVWVFASVTVSVTVFDPLVV